jgi:hypothetical protein
MADGAAAPLTGDIVQVTPSARRVSFIWSYPNTMPLPAAEVRCVAERVAPWSNDCVHGAFASPGAARDGSAIVALGGTLRGDPEGSMARRY